MGGKGMSISDLLLGGDVNTPRRITTEIEEGAFIQVMRRLIIFIDTKRILLYLQKWDLSCIAFLSHGLVFSDRFRESTK